MNKALSVTTTTLLLLLIANVFVDVVLRYAFNNSSIALQELEWHLIQATWVATFLANFKGQISKIKAVISNQ
jgi:TRAP-type mannitol/chloroaromatic compound transport system permease small subunit